VFTGSIGLEACVYDPGTKTFFINNDGTTANPAGELDTILATTAAAGAPVVAQRFPEGNCGPAGIALGPSENLIIGCDAPAGDPQITLIMSATSGAIVQDDHASRRRGRSRLRSQAQPLLYGITRHDRQRDFGDGSGRRGVHAGPRGDRRVDEHVVGKLPDRRERALRRRR